MIRWSLQKILVANGIQNFEGAIQIIEKNGNQKLTDFKVNQVYKKEKKTARRVNDIQISFFTHLQERRRN